MKFKVVSLKKILLLQVVLFSFFLCTDAKVCVDFSSKSLLAFLNGLQENTNASFEEIESSGSAGANSIIDELSDVIWEGTETIIETININTKNQTDAVADRTESVIDELQMLETVVEGLDQLVIDRNLSKSGNFITTGTTITSGGYYSLRETTTGCITVAVNDVILDLGGFTLYCEVAPVITVNSGLKNVEIKNGKIKSDGSQHGILVNNSCSLVAIKQMKFFSCDKAIECDGLASEIKNCKIKHCDFYNCSCGVALNRTSRIVVESCNSCVCQSGFLQENSDFNVYKSCKAFGANASFVSQVGGGSLFFECVSLGAKGVGFAFENEGFSKIVRCLVNQTIGAVALSTWGIIINPGVGCVLECNEVLNSNGYGIYLRQDIAEDNLLLRNVAYNNAVANFFPKTGVTFIRNIYDYDHDGNFFATTDPNRYDNLDVLAC